MRIAVATLLSNVYTKMREAVGDSVEFLGILERSAKLTMIVWEDRVVTPFIAMDKIPDSLMIPFQVSKSKSYAISNFLLKCKDII